VNSPAWDHGCPLRRITKVNVSVWGGVSGSVAVTLNESGFSSFHLLICNAFNRPWFVGPPGAGVRPAVGSQVVHAGFPETAHACVRVRLTGITGVDADGPGRQT